MRSHFHIPRIPYGLPLLFASICFVGCGSEVEEEVVPPLQTVHGQVSFKGKPTEGISVSFLPFPGSTGNGAYGTTDAEGNYTLKYRTGEAGIPAGKYVVLFSKLVQPDGSPIPEGQTAADVGAVNVIPNQYRDMEKPVHQVEVKEGDNKFDFKLDA